MHGAWPTTATRCRPHWWPSKPCAPPEAITVGSSSWPRGQKRAGAPTCPRSWRTYRIASVCPMSSWRSTPAVPPTTGCGPQRRFVDCWWGCSPCGSSNRASTAARPGVRSLPRSASLGSCSIASRMPPRVISSCPSCALRHRHGPLRTPSLPPPSWETPPMETPTMQTLPIRRSADSYSRGRT